jgi:tRNA-2-methylthio-N6-dimethylallyladenosine synthase
MVTVTVTHAAPHHLIADSAIDGGEFSVRRTRSGDSWAEREHARLGAQEAHSHGGAKLAAGGPISIGLPSIGKPAAASPVGGGCG